jgi:multiple sugar transport system substrate-binding protein
MLHGISPEMVKQHPTDSVWLIEGYKPTAAAAGVVATVEGGAPTYPMLPYMGLMHDALGANLVDFIQGKESAEQALADAEKAYVTAATEAGYLK